MVLSTNKNIIAMTSEEIEENISLEEAHEWILNAKNEAEIADVYAVAENHAWWLAHDIDDYEENSNEHKAMCKQVDDWFLLANRIEEKIFNILESENILRSDVGTRKKIESFMVRNGYFDANGWWVKKEV